MEIVGCEVTKNGASLFPDETLRLVVFEAKGDAAVTTAALKIGAVVFRLQQSITIVVGSGADGSKCWLLKTHKNKYSCCLEYILHQI